MNSLRSTFQITFFLRTDKQRKDQSCPLYIRITLNKSQSLIGMHINLQKQQWNAPLQKVVKSPQAREMNLELDAIRLRLVQVYQTLLESSSSLSAGLIKDVYLAPTQHKEKLLLQTVKAHNDEMEALLGSKYSKGSLKNYRTTLKSLTGFVLEGYKEADVPLKFVDYGFIVKFEQYVIKHGCGNNGAMKHLQRLRKILNYALRNDWLDHNPFRKYTISFKRVERGFLDLEEIQRIDQAELESSGQEKVRRWFLFACYTGLPYADLKALKWENIRKGADENLWLDIRRQKTDTSILLPLLPQAKVLLPSKGTGLVFGVYSNQKVNDYLKIIATKANVEKKVSFHLARHTFATTITLSNGIPIETVSKMLGHTNIKTTQIYSKVVELKISKDMDKLLKQSL